MPRSGRDGRLTGRQEGGADLTSLSPGTQAHAHPAGPDPREPERLSPTARAVALALAATLLATAITLAWFRGADGYPSGRIAVPLAIASALAVAGFAGGWLGLPACAWLAATLICQAAALQLMHAGNLIGYQHYLNVRALTGRDDLPWLALLVAQALAVLVALWRKRAALARFIGRLGTPLRLAAVGLIFFITSATLSREPASYIEELAFATFVQLLSLATVGLAAAAVPRESVAAITPHLNRWFGEGAKAAGSGKGLDRFALLGALWATAVAALLCWVSYGRHPHIPDEVVYLYHARYFAHGMLSMPAPPVPEAFNLGLMAFEPTRWYSPVPPGWPAVLAIGAVFGAAWLVNPVLAGLNVLLAFVLVRDLYDRGTARLSTVLLCVSPWFLFMSMNFMTHTLSMTAALIAALATLRARRKGNLWWTALAGVCIGMMAMIRPLEAVAIAMLLGLWSLRSPDGAWRIRSTLLMVVVTVAVVAVTNLPYNRYLTGSATTFPLPAFVDAHNPPGSNDLGFGANRGFGWEGLDPLPGHGPVDLLVNANLNTYQVATELLGWGTGSLLLLALLLFCGKVRRPDLLMLAVIGMIVGIHSFYWFAGGPDFGARYWYLILLPCIVLSARGIQELSRLLSGAQKDAPPPGAATAAISDPAGARVGLASAVLILGSLVAFIPWRAMDKYHNYRGMRTDVREMASRLHFGNSLVLIRGNRFPDYSSAAIYNPIDLGAHAPVYVWDENADVRDRVVRAFSSRPVWILDGPSVTGAGYRVRRGPIPAEELLAEDQVREP